jgi:malate dehydrogenase (oxaloacetate-decarboxylating)(NADP+)
MTIIMTNALLIGPILIGAAKPAHILTPSETARGIINMTAVSVAKAQGESQTETQKAIFSRVSLV